MTEKTNIFRPFWRFQNISMEDIKTIIDTGIEILNRKATFSPTKRSARTFSPHHRKGQKIQRSGGYFHP